MHWRREHLYLYIFNTKVVYKALFSCLAFIYYMSVHALIFSILQHKNTHMKNKNM